MRLKKTAQFVDDTASIYDQAWSQLRKDYTPMDPASLYDELRKVKMIMDPEMIWYAYLQERTHCLLSCFCPMPIRSSDI